MANDKAPVGIVHPAKFSSWVKKLLHPSHDYLPHFSKMEFINYPNLRPGKHHTGLPRLPWKLFVGTMNQSHLDLNDKVYAYLSGDRNEKIVFEHQDKPIPKGKLSRVQFNSPFSDVNGQFPHTPVGRPKLNAIILYYFIVFSPYKVKNRFIEIEDTFWEFFKNACLAIQKKWLKRGSDEKSTTAKAEEGEEAGHIRFIPALTRDSGDTHGQEIPKKVGRPISLRSKADPSSSTKLSSKSKKRKCGSDNSMGAVKRQQAVHQVCVHIELSYGY